LKQSSITLDIVKNVMSVQTVTVQMSRQINSFFRN
jgi:hypothetical protein